MKIMTLEKAFLILLFPTLFSCEDYLEIDAPDHKIISSTVFENDQTAQSALVGMYNQLASVHFSGGGASGVTVLGALSADVVKPIYERNLPYMEFDQHRILPDNFRNLNLWSSAYNVIYMANGLLDGGYNSESISDPVRKRIMGEASFIRAFTYFYLVNLYGDVPLVLTTDYRINSVAERNSEEDVYQQITTDLQTAVDLLNSDYSAGDRTVVNKYAAVALMARVQLYQGNWLEAEMLSRKVIEQSGSYEILEDLNSVFLTGSQEAIWYLSPKGRGLSLTNTQEGASFLIHPMFYFLAQFKLELGFVNSFSSEDKRLMNWIGFHQATSYYFPNKYKIFYSTEEPTEYSMVLRLAEQYLIRAEARAMQDNLSGAISDLDIIRERAGLTLIADTNPGVGKSQLLQLILQERKKELFTEWGHRWFDLKRTGKAEEVFATESSLWQQTDAYYPIPESERMSNPNLTQNGGY